MTVVTLGSNDRLEVSSMTLWIRRVRVVKDRLYAGERKRTGNQDRRNRTPKEHEKPERWCIADRKQTIPQSLYPFVGGRWGLDGTTESRNSKHHAIPEALVTNNRLTILALGRTPVLPRVDPMCCETVTPWCGRLASIGQN